MFLESPQPERERTPQTLQTPVLTPPVQKRDIENEDAYTNQLEDAAKLDIPAGQVASGSGERRKPKPKPREEKTDDEEVEATVSLIKQSVYLSEERLSKKTRITSDHIKRKMWAPPEEEEEEDGKQLEVDEVWPGIEEPAEIPIEEPKISHKTTSDRRAWLSLFFSWTVLTQQVSRSS